MNSLYCDELIEHYKSSLFRKSIMEPTSTIEHSNPSCGDKVSLSFVLTNDIIQDIGFQGTGCIISQAAISLLCEHVLGQKIDFILNLTSHDILQLIGIDLGPVRIHCALLGLQALQKSLQELNAKVP